MGIFDETGYADEMREGIDFYLSKQGYRVLTEHYLKERGYCCGNGCLHCPYFPKAMKGNTNLRDK
jgi:hypothetical protein